MTEVCIKVKFYLTNIKRILFCKLKTRPRRDEILRWKRIRWYFLLTLISIGRFEDEKRTGFGKMMYPDGSIYEGFWLNDK
jgi:hypothetical protein